MEIRDRVKRVRKELNKTQAEFSVALGFAPTSAASWEKKDAQIPSPLAMNMMERVFNINIEWLKTGKGSMFLDNANINDVISRMIDQYSNGSHVFRSLLEAYLEMTEPQQEAFDAFVDSFVDNYNRRSGKASQNSSQAESETWVKGFTEERRSTDKSTSEDPERP